MKQNIEYYLDDIAKELLPNLYHFEYFRNELMLTEHKVGFFQPFDEWSDFVIQSKTFILSPILGIFIFGISITSIILSVFSLVFDLISARPDLIYLDFIDILREIFISLTAPLVAIMVSIASLVALFTRTLATFIPSCAGDEFNSEFLNGVHSMTTTTKYRLLEHSDKLSEGDDEQPYIQRVDV